MVSVLKLNLTFNQQCTKIDLKNLQEADWNEVTEEQKLRMHKLRIDGRSFGFLWRINLCRLFKGYLKPNQFLYK